MTNMQITQFFQSKAYLVALFEIEWKDFSEILNMCNVKAGSAIVSGFNDGLIFTRSHHLMKFCLRFVIKTYIDSEFSALKLPKKKKRMKTEDGLNESFSFF
jgi:hypothetical protein